MLQDMIQTPEQLSIHDCISSPLSDQILDFKYDEDLFEEPIDPSLISSPSTNANDPASTATDPTATAAPPFPTVDDTVAISCYGDAFASAFSTFDSSDILSDLLSTQPPPEPEPDILPMSSMGSPLLPTLPMALPFASSNQTGQLDRMIAAANGFPTYSSDSMARELPLALSGYLGMEQSSLRPCSFLDTRDIYTDGMGVQMSGGDGEMELFAGGRTGAGPPEVRPRSAEACGIMMYAPGSMHRVYGSGDLQVLRDGHHLVGRCSSNTASLSRASDGSSLDDSTYKVGRLSVEERKEKIHRYIKKRHERNFSKKIKYACRKTLADSRPRVRGRFAKNDEFGEAITRSNSVHHEYDDDDDDDDEMDVKHEENILESSDILAHISGVNPLTYYTVESWI